MSRPQIDGTRWRAWVCAPDEMIYSSGNVVILPVVDIQCVPWKCATANRFSGASNVTSGIIIHQVQAKI